MHQRGFFYFIRVYSILFYFIYSIYFILFILLFLGGSGDMPNSVNYKTFSSSEEFKKILEVQNIETFSPYLSIFILSSRLKLVDPSSHFAYLSLHYSSVLFSLRLFSFYFFSTLLISSILILIHFPSFLISSHFITSPHIISFLLFSFNLTPPLFI